MTLTDLKYMPVVYETINNGIYHQVHGAKYKDGSDVFAYKHRERVVLEYDLQKEFPILSSKQVFWESLRNEIFWFYVLQSNTKEDLDKLGIKFWDDWVGKDGTIGKAYGYQVKKYKLIDRVINTIKTNPDDRGNIMSLWNEEDLPFMNIRPCALMTMWDVSDGYLNCTLIQRSGDAPVGVPFNLSQYAMLTHMIAHVTGLKVGKLTHVINNAHVYDRHVEGIRLQMTKPIHPAPKIVLNPDVKNFADFRPEDVILEGYQHSGKIPFELAVVTNPFKSK